MFDGNKIVEFVNTIKYSLGIIFERRGLNLIYEDLGRIVDRDKLEKLEKYDADEYAQNIYNTGIEAIASDDYMYWEKGILEVALGGGKYFEGTTVPSTLRGPIVHVSNSIIKSSFGGFVYAWIVDQIPEQTLVIELGFMDSESPSENNFTLKMLILPNDRPLTGYMAQIASMYEFTKQPFIEQVSLDRVAAFSNKPYLQHEKRSAKKIRIVYLRRREQHPTLSDGSPNPVDWSCQWLVKGHWRNQYHPSDQSHKPTFIQSYVKGPEDKPFKAPTERIFAAVR